MRIDDILSALPELIEKEINNWRLRFGYE